MSYRRGGYQVRFGFGTPMTPAVKALLIANGAIFLIQVLSHSLASQSGGDRTWFEQLFALTPGLVVERLHLWQLLTHSFLHDVQNLWHIALNMLILWMLGRDVEWALGRSRFLRLYFAAAVAGGVCMMPWYFFMKDVSVLGASGAVLGVMAMFARLFPERRLLVLGIFPVRAKTLVLILAAVDLLAAISGSDAGTAHLAHLGGMAVGWYFPSLERWFERLRRKWEFQNQQRTERHEQDIRAEVDRLLAKVGREGLGSLTDKEREFLNRTGKRFQR